MSLLSCPECNHIVSSQAFFCPGCGYPMQLNIPARSVTQSPISKRKKAISRRKLPNGYGSIKKLSGNRSRPYAAYPSSAGNNASSSRKPPAAIGYFTDWHSAYIALSEYHSRPYDLSKKDYTFHDIYTLFYKDKFETSRKHYSVSSRQAYESAFKNCSTLHNKSFTSIRKQEMQEVLDNCTLGYSSVCNLKKLFSQMYRFALENDITEKNYARFVTNNHEDDTEKGEPFSPDELNVLWSHQDDASVQVILLMIYSGFRIKAFETIEINAEKLYFVGGVKTAAGKGRIVPIHDSIRPFVSCFKTAFPAFKAANFRRTFFYPTLERLGIATTANGKKHTPHDCRHTFSWLCDKYKIDDLSKHMLMGHSPGKDVEKSVYGHRTLEELRSEINKIQI